MRNTKIIILVAVFVGSAMIVFAAAKKEIPPWMENADATGRSTYLVPKGAKRQVVGSQVLVEAPNEYTARRLYEMDEYIEQRFQKIEEEQKNISEELKKVMEMVEPLREGSTVIQNVDRLRESMEKLETRLNAFEASLALPGEAVATQNDESEMTGETETVENIEANPTEEMIEGTTP